MNARFIMLNTPPRHRIHFLIPTERDHSRLRKLLQIGGDHFQEKLVPNATLRMDRFARGKRAPQQLSLLFGSTVDEKVVEAIFEYYRLEYGSLYLFPFAIAAEDFGQLNDNLERAYEPGAETISSRLIERSHCVMVTDWDHRMEMFSDKIDRGRVEVAAGEVANRLSLDLHVRDLRKLA